MIEILLVQILHLILRKISISMIKIIKKGSEPSIFPKLRSEYGNYDNIGDQKSLLKEILISEQNYRCVYCMRKINMNTSSIEHYVPRHGDNGDISKSLDYRNLFAVCKITEGRPYKKQTCDVRKGDSLLHISPLNETHINSIEYKRNGEMYSNNHDFNDDINNTLNLNEMTLVQSRFEAYRSLLDIMNTKKKNNWSKKFIEKTLNKFLDKDNRQPYIGFIIYNLKKRLSKM